MQTVALVGFQNGDPEAPEGFFGAPMEYEGSLPEAPTMALLLDSTHVDAEATMRRRVDVNKALGRGATILVFVGPEGQSGAGTSLGASLIHLIGTSLSWLSPSHIEAARSDLKPYFDDHLAHAHWIGEVPDGAEVLARISGDVVPASLRFARGKSSVYIVPLRSRTNSAAEARRFVQLLPDEGEYPSYLDELDLGGEAEARAEGSRLTARLNELDDQLQAARRTKRILYFKEMSLQHEVVRFFAEELGVPARFVPGNREDFVLVNDSDEPWCIGEVKGRDNASVTKFDVNAVTNHRSARELTEDFPTLLVMNTLSRRESLVDRDESLHHDVLKRASEDHVVVVRTLDLVRIKRALLGGDGGPRDALLGAVRSGGGWFEMTDGGDFGLRTN